jgi:hypothetical protein
LLFKQVAKKLSSHLLIATPLHQNFNDISVLVDRPIQIMELTLNGHKGFVNVPDITQAAFSPFELPRIIRAKLETPLANGFIGHRDSPFSQECFHFTETETEAMVQPDGVTNNPRGRSLGLKVFMPPSLP